MFERQRLARRTENHVRISKRLIAVNFLALGLSNVAAAFADTTPGEATRIIARGVPYAERQIAKIATDIANSRSFFYEDYGRITIDARYDTEKGILYLDPGDRFGSISAYAEMEDMHQWISNSLEPVVGLLPNYSHTVWLYGGRDLYFWFPEQRRSNESVMKTYGQDKVLQSHVLVSAGHGYYFHHGFKDWRPQREVSNGILEDEITIPLAEMLTGELLISGVDVTGTRNSSFKFHEPSKQPYHMIAARYQLEELLPSRPDIWHSLPSATDALREYHEDILSRPLYANFLGASEVIHVHTNASSNAAAHGTQVIVQESRPADAMLGRMILCYMKEHIHNIPAYKDFHVPEKTIFDDKGENRVAHMPSVIVEVGFHTNASDANALKDFRFQSAAMIGAAKGYRLYKRGEDCSEFAISAPEKSEGVAGSNVSFPIAFEGNPDFPVVIEVEEKCDGPYCHRKSDVFYSKEDFSGYEHSFFCRKAPADRPVVPLVAKARDYKGVETKAIVHTVLCASPPAAM